MAEFNYPENMTKPQALTRRANKFLEWLQWPEYADYINHDTTLHLIKLTALINQALQKSMTIAQWDYFRYALLDCRYLAKDTFEDNEAERINYYLVMDLLKTTLNEYIVFVNSNDISVVYSE
jgi:hypothetical protein